jgi:hypothetical protein
MCAEFGAKKMGMLVREVRTVRGGWYRFCERGRV